MLAVIAAGMFLIAEILHRVGHAKFVLDFELIGFILLAIHVATGWVPAWWPRRGGQ